MNDRDLVAILAALISLGTKRPPEDFLQEAINLAGAAGRAVDDSKLTTVLRIRFDVMQNGA
jgi:hypothetical protein